MPMLATKPVFHRTRAGLAAGSVPVQDRLRAISA